MTDASADRPKIGLLGLSLELYETLAPGLREGRENWVRSAVLPALASHADVVFHGAVFRRDAIETEVARLEAEGADALLVVLLTYSPSQIALPALRRTPLPLLVWNTQELFAVDRSFGTDAMLANHGVHGTQDLCNVLLRSGVRFEYVTSHLSDPAAGAVLEHFFRAAAAVRRLRTLRVGLLGYPFPGMGDFALDTTHLAATLGCEWTNLTVAEYIRRCTETPADQAAALVAAYRESYDVASDVTDEDLDLTARTEQALRGMVRDHNLGALAYQFMAFGDDDRTPTVPFVAMSRLMAEGIGFGGEGDIIAAAGTAFLNALQPPASFCEAFTMDFGGNALFMSHMGEANVAMARRDRTPRLVARGFPITPTRGRQLEIVTCFEPGPATLCALTLGPGSRWRLIASKMTVPDFGPLDALDVPHFKLQPAGDVREFLNAYAQAGGPHHSAVCVGDALPRLKHAAALLDADYCEL